MTTTDTNDLYPTTKGMTDRDVHARQLASRRVTLSPDPTRPPRPVRSEPHLLVSNFHYAATPTVTRVR